MKMTSQHERVVIIGSGPAAWTAAIYAARADLSPLVVEGAGSRTMIPGGQLMFTTEVENYPGFPEGVTGPEMMDAFRAQALRFDTRVITDDIVEVALAGQPKRLVTGRGQEILAESVIVATGANARWLGVPNEERLAQSGAGSPRAPCATERCRTSAARSWPWWVGATAPSRTPPTWRSSRAGCW